MSITESTYSSNFKIDIPLRGSIELFNAAALFLRLLIILYVIIYVCLVISFCSGLNIVIWTEKDLHMSLDGTVWGIWGSSCGICCVKFYTRLVIIYIAIFCIFASKFAKKANWAGM